MHALSGIGRSKEGRSHGCGWLPTMPTDPRGSTAHPPIHAHTYPPLCLRDLSVVANTIAALASCALVIQAFVPFNTYSSPGE